MDLTVHVTAVERQQIKLVGLTRHAIDAEVPDHLDRSVLEFVRMEVGRPELYIEIGDLSSDPSANDIIPGSRGPDDIPLCRVFAFGRTAGQDGRDNTQHTRSASTPFDVASSAFSDSKCGAWASTKTGRSIIGARVCVNANEQLRSAPEG